MPLTGIYIAASGDDQVVQNAGATYPPADYTPSYVTNGSLLEARRTYYTGFPPDSYYGGNILLKFNTAPLSDTDDVARAYLELEVTDKNVTDARSLSFDWFTWSGSNGAADYTNTAGTSAHAGTAISALSIGINTFPLTGLTNVNRTGNTYLRGHITGGTPTGVNNVYIASFDNPGSYAIPRLVVVAGRPQLRATSSVVSTSTGANTLAVPVPTGTALGDQVLVGILYKGGTGAAPTAASGFTLLTSGRIDSTTNLGLAIYQKVAGAGESGSYSFGVDATTARAAVGVAASVYHADGTPPLTLNSGQANASSTTVTAPTLSPTDATSMLLGFFGVDSASTFTNAVMTEQVDTQGLGPGGSGTAQSYYLIDTRIASGTNNHYNTQATAPTDAAHATATGWIANSNAVGQSAILRSLTEIARNAADWGATLQPAAAPSATNGDAWRTPTALSGSFASGNWTLSLSVRSITAAYAGRFRFRWRVWRSANADGSGATELTSAQVASAISAAALTTTANTTVSATWAAPAITVNNEYLFFQVGIEVTTTGSGTTQDINLRKNSASAVTTTALTPASTASLELATQDLSASGATGTRTATATATGVNIGHLVAIENPQPPFPQAIGTGIDADEGSSFSADVHLLLQRVFAGFSGPLFPDDYLPGDWILEAPDGEAYGPTVSAGTTTLTAGKTIQPRWNVAAVVSDSIQPRWNVSAVVSDTVQPRWNVLARVNDTVQPRWNVAALINDAIQPRWNIAALISDAIQPRWNVASLASDAIQPRWNVSALVNDAIQPRWNVLSRVTDTIQPRWNVSSLASDSIQPRWNVSAFASDSIQPRWNVAALVNDTIQPRWNVAALASDAIQPRWNVAALVSDSIQPRWNVSQLAGLASDTITVRWNVAAVVNDTVQPRWNVLSRVNDTIQPRWNVLILVNDSIQPRWNIAVLVNDAIQPRWNVRALVNDSIQPRWNVAALVSDTIQPRWNVLSGFSVGDAIIVKWNVRSLLPDAVTVKWNVQGLSAAPLYPDAILSMSGYTGDVSLLRQDPDDAGDVTWLVVSGG